METGSGPVTGDATPEERSRRFRSRSVVSAFTMIVLLVLYLGVALQHAIVLILLPQPVAKAMGVALLLFPVVGIWAIWAEIRFAIRGNRLIGLLLQEGPLPTDDLPVLPSGRAVREAAEERVERYRAAVEADPLAWRGWMCLGLLQDAAGKRSAGRASIVKAIRLERASR